MAVNESRSMTEDMQKGANDGMYKSLTPDRGGNVDLSNVLTRQTQLQEQYNIVDFLLGKTVQSNKNYEYGYAED